MLNGRYGPYITDGKRNARIPKDTDPKAVTLELCRELLAVAPLRGSRFGRKKTAERERRAPRKTRQPRRGSAATAEAREEIRGEERTKVGRSRHCAAKAEKKSTPRKRNPPRARNAKSAAAVPKKSSSKPKKNEASLSAYVQSRGFARLN